MNTIKNALEKCRTYVAVQKFGCGHTGIGHGVEDNLLQLLNEAFEELARLEKREPTLMSDCISAGLPLDVALKYDVQLCRLTNYVRDKALADYVKQEPVAVISESAIGLVKLHSNGVSLPFGTQLYAAPVSAKREWVDLTEGEQESIYLKCNTPSEYINAAIAAFKEKNT